MRKLIRKKILEGKSDDEIRAELVQEFGEDILNKIGGSGGFLLWLLPLVFAGVAGVLVFRFVRK